MSCFSPLFMEVIGHHRDGDGHVKKDLRFVNFHYDGRDLTYKRHLVRVPCGKCIGCRMDYSRMWMVRMCAEAQYHDKSYFLTLTYDDDHVPYGVSSDGELVGYTLRKRDVQLFLKRLRKTKSLRYYACGEYGSGTLRPHYHMIAFGLDLDDLVPYKQSTLGDMYYSSVFLEKTWQNGFVTVGDFSPKSAAYVSRYVVKKAMGQNFDVDGLEPEFVLMSRRPGIGARWLEDHEGYGMRYMYLSSEKGGVKSALPRYFKDKLGIESTLSLSDLYDQELHKIALTDLSYDDIMRVGRESLEARIKGLKRDL